MRKLSNTGAEKGRGHGEEAKYWPQPPDLYRGRRWLQMRPRCQIRSPGCTFVHVKTAFRTLVSPDDVRDGLRVVRINKIPITEVFVGEIRRMFVVLEVIIIMEGSKVIVRDESRRYLPVGLENVPDKSISSSTRDRAR
jgi:hypothetical protein